MTENEFIQAFEDAVAAIGAYHYDDMGKMWVGLAEDADEDDFGRMCPIKTVVTHKGGVCSNEIAGKIGPSYLGLTVEQAKRIIHAADNTLGNLDECYANIGVAGAFPGTEQQFECLRGRLKEAIRRGLARRSGGVDQVGAAGD